MDWMSGDGVNGESRVELQLTGTVCVTSSWDKNSHGRVTRGCSRGICQVLEEDGGSVFDCWRHGKMRTRSYCLPPPFNPHPLHPMGT